MVGVDNGGLGVVTATFIIEPKLPDTDFFLQTLAF